MEETGSFPNRQWRISTSYTHKSPSIIAFKFHPRNKLPTHALNSLSLQKKKMLPQIDITARKLIFHRSSTIADNNMFVNSPSTVSSPTPSLFIIFNLKLRFSTQIFTAISLDQKTEKGKKKHHNLKSNKLSPFASMD